MFTAKLEKEEVELNLSKYLMHMLSHGFLNIKSDALMETRP